MPPNKSKNKGSRTSARMHVWEHAYYLQYHESTISAACAAVERDAWYEMIQMLEEQTVQSAFKGVNSNSLVASWIMHDSKEMKMNYRII